MHARHRKRMERREIPGGVRFLTFSCEGSLPLLGNEAIRGVFAEALASARVEFGFELFAWVAMPEHAHVLARPAMGRSLGPAIASLKLSVGKTVIARWRVQGAPILQRITGPDGRPRFWLKGGGFDRNVRDEAEFAREVRYIHRNPVERGLVQRAEQWRASSARWWLGFREGEVECDPPPGCRDWSGWTGFV